MSIPTRDLSCGGVGRGVDADLEQEADDTKNLLDKDVLSKRSVGVPEEVLHRTAEVLRIA
jgi:hypothetical protein